jgi:hypothetical protein
VGYVASDSEQLYVIITDMINTDPTGAFIAEADLDQFESYLEPIVADLNLPIQQP